MVAQLTIHFHFVGCRGECSAGLGACKKMKRQYQRWNFAKTGEADDDK
jgi:hypothetical protein